MMLSVPRCPQLCIINALFYAWCRKYGTDEALYAIAVYYIYVGQVVSVHHSDHMSQRWQISQSALLFFNEVYHQ